MQNPSNVYGFPTLQAKKAVILARVSSRDQEDGYSIDAQKHRLESYCARKNLTLLKTFAIVESSTNGDRKQFMSMLKFIKGQRETIALVADKVDRVQRSFKEYPLLDGLIQQGKIELHFNTENYVIHKDSVSQERLMWSMGVIMAQSYIDSMRDNVKRSIEQKIRLGEWITRAPIGYLNVKDERGRSDIIVDPLRSTLVTRMFEKYATGTYTIPELTEMAKGWGLTTGGTSIAPSRSHVHRMLKNPFYYGFMQIKGQFYEHRYQPIVSMEVFQHCQNILQSYNKKPFEYGKHEFVFRGLLSCATSGKVVSADTKRKTYKNGESAEWTYLICRNPKDPNKNQWVREDSVLAQLTDALRRLTVPPHIMVELKSYLSSTSHSERSYLKRQMAEWQKEHTLCQSRLDRLTDLLLDATIQRDDYYRKKSQLRKRQIELEQHIENARVGDDAFKEVMLNLLDIASESYMLFMNSSLEEKRQLINFVFSNLQLEGQNLRFSLRKPFDQMLVLTTSEEWLHFLDDFRTYSFEKSWSELIPWRSKIKSFLGKRRASISCL